MKKFNLKFIISKWANFYFLVDNFAEYKPLNIREYNKEIIKQFGKLKRKEKIAIKQYRETITFLKERSSEKGSFKNLRNCFYTSTCGHLKIWKSVSNVISEPQYNVLKSVFTLWQPRFEKIWGEYRYTLKQNHKILKQNYPLVKKGLSLVFDKLSTFYGVKDYKKSVVEIYLIIMPLKYYFQAGMTIAENKMILSVGPLKRNGHKKINSVWKLIFHELTHLLFETIEYKDRIRKYIFRKRPLSKLIQVKGIQNVRQQTLILFNEVINSSTVWNLWKFENVFSSLKLQAKDRLEIIRNKLKDADSNNKRKKVIFDLNTIKQYVAWKLEFYFKKYILEKKKIDKRYLDAIYSLLSDYPKNLLRDLKNKRVG